MYTEKYEEVDLKFINASDINDRDECVWLMTELDDVIASIEDQLRNSRADHDAGYETDARWINSAKFAVKKSKITRARIQVRSGVLSRELRDEENIQKTIAHKELMKMRPSEDRAFIEASKEVLTKVEYLAVWDKAKKMFPESFPTPPDCPDEQQEKENEY